MLGLSFVYLIFLNNKHNVQCNKSNYWNTLKNPITIAGLNELTQKLMNN